MDLFDGIKKAWKKATLCGDCKHSEINKKVSCTYKCKNLISPCKNRVTFADFGCTYGKPKNSQDIRRLNMEDEPRMMLDTDSQCYGCPYYKKDINCTQEHNEDEFDENCGTCDVDRTCAGGIMNGYRMEG